MMKGSIIKFKNKDNLKELKVFWSTRESTKIN